MKECKVVEYSNGDKCWFLNSDLHREDGPAIEYANGDKHWYLKGKLHREDGPAIEDADGTKYWYLNGTEYIEKEFLRKTAMKELTMAELVKILGYNVKIVK